MEQLQTTWKYAMIVPAVITHPVFALTTYSWELMLLIWRMREQSNASRVVRITIRVSTLNLWHVVSIITLVSTQRRYVAAASDLRQNLTKTVFTTRAFFVSVKVCQSRSLQQNMGYQYLP